MLESSTCRLKYISTAEPFTVAHVKFSIVFRRRASLMPLSLVFGRSNTRKAAKLAVYDATMIMAKPAHTIPKTRAEKLLGVPSPMPLFNKTPHANQMAELRFNASSSVLSFVDSLNRPNGENLTIKRNFWNELLAREAATNRNLTCPINTVLMRPHARTPSPISTVCC